MGVRTDFLHVPTLFDVDLAWFNHIFLCRFFLCTFETSQHVTRPGTNLWHCRTGTRKWQCRMGNHIFHWWIIVFTPFFFANVSHPTKHPKTWSTIPWISLWHKLPVKKWWVSVNVAAGLAELETWFGSPRSAWQLRGSLTFQCFSMQKRYVPTGSHMPWIKNGLMVTSGFWMLKNHHFLMIQARSKHFDGWIPHILVVSHHFGWSISHFFC